ncbi:unnamed protein product [Caenorhabditis auriculariae]|uniref:Uncharacterized protein n=1 Tax=Caenorhabditis auriculariae TaxID=2777116 RepID=A0A8S1GWW3_9PELO|nr:unnamed protein product [Caenorhabditis auriculariae]
MGENDPRSATIAQHQTYFCVLVVETLAIVPCLVIASVSFAKYDAEEYQEAHKEISQVIRHQFLFPLVAVQSVWVASDVLAVISVFCTVPYLLSATSCRLPRRPDYCNFTTRPYSGRSYPFYRVEIFFDISGCRSIYLHLMRTVLHKQKEGGAKYCGETNCAGPRAGQHFFQSAFHN